MTRLMGLCSLTAVAGFTLLFAEIRWFGRISPSERLAPYQRGARRSERGGVLSVTSFRDVIGPLSKSLGERLARISGFDEDLQRRLTRIHSPLDVTAFRVRQIGSALGALGVAILLVVALATPPGLSVVILVAAPAGTFLVVEQSLASRSAAWQHRIFLELSVIAEQLGMLISAGWSLGSAIGRVAERGTGACSRDLRRVQTRMRQGLSEIEALREWAELAAVDELDGLVATLSLNRDTADLGRLIGEEARSIRRQAQRQLIEAIERRTQQVWIPVTVAALVPGVLLMGVPFMDALSLFST